MNRTNPIVELDEQLVRIGAAVGQILRLAQIQPVEEWFECGTLMILGT